MKKLTEIEIEKMLDEEENMLVYRMYTSKGVKMRMQIAKFYYKNYNIFTYIIIQFPLLVVDMIDSFVYFIQNHQQK